MKKKYFLIKFWKKNPKLFLNFSKFLKNLKNFQNIVFEYELKCIQTKTHVNIASGNPKMYR